MFFPSDIGQFFKVLLKGGGTVDGTYGGINSGGLAHEFTAPNGTKVRVSPGAIAAVVVMPPKADKAGGFVERGF